MLIMSWNVAGLSTTVNRIHDAYLPAVQAEAANNTSNSSNKKIKLAPSATLEHFIRRHSADILCIQEHKIPLKQLSNKAEPRGCSSVEGYESFWSCCSDSSKRGFNGVVTYCRKGLVVSADSTPFGDPELDEQGRCVLTDHGAFCIFNVYAPAGGGTPLPNRMKFFNALRALMKRQRERGKRVLLVGDLNIRHTALDTYWKDRTVFVNQVVSEVQSSSNPLQLSSWKRQLAEKWPKISTALRDTKQVAATQTTNSKTKQKYGKFRLYVTCDDKKIYLGSHETSKEACHWYYDFSACSYLSPETLEEVPVCGENEVSIKILAELMTKIGGIEWDEATQRQICSEHADISPIAPTRKWFNSLLVEDTMVDAFRQFYPNSEGRFTCWDQSRNRRYGNDGCRLDYTLVDSALVPFIEKGGSIRTCGSEADPCSEVAALSAATANGRFQPAAFEGGGIVEASQEALDSQFGERHTGIIYTPPSFSDHVGISLLLNDSCCPSALELDEKDSATKKAQPHKSQKSIASFFKSSSAASRSGETKNNSSSVKLAPAQSQQQRKRKGIESFLVSQSSSSSSISSSSKSSRSEKFQPGKKGNEKSNILQHFQKK